MATVSTSQTLHLIERVVSEGVLAWINELMERLALGSVQLLLQVVEGYKAANQLRENQTVT